MKSISVQPFEPRLTFFQTDKVVRTRVPVHNLFIQRELVSEPLHTFTINTLYVLPDIGDGVYTKNISPHARHRDVITHRDLFIIETNIFSHVYEFSIVV